MACVEKAVKGCKGFVRYEFIPEENVVSVKVFEYDEYAEYSDDFESYDYIEVVGGLLNQIKTDCKDIAKNIEVYVPNRFDRMCYGYFNYHEILITPLN